MEDQETLLLKVLSKRSEDAQTIIKEFEQGIGSESLKEDPDAHIVRDYLSELAKSEASILYDYYEELASLYWDRFDSSTTADVAILNKKMWIRCETVIRYILQGSKL